MKNISVILLSFVSLAAFSQTAMVRGLVKDELSQVPIVHATAHLVGTNFTDTTNSSGLFTLKNVPYGNYTIEIIEGTHTTFSDKIEVNKPEIVVGSVGLSIAEEEVDRSEKRGKAASEDNLPTVTVSENDAVDIGAQNIGSALASTRDAFISTTSFIQSNARFRIRGYAPGLFDVYVNGVPMNDLINGSIPTSSWGGLTDVMRNRQYSLGLSSSDFSFGGVGGSYYLDAEAYNQRKGFDVSYSVANRNFRNRLMATWSSGILKHGWAISASFSRRWADQGKGYVPGTFYDGYSYYLSLDKHFGANNVLNFTTFGAPTKEGKDLATTQEAYDLAGSNYYNPAWGYQNGQVRNGYVINTFQPVFILNDKWTIDEKSNLQTAASFSFGARKNSSIDYYNAPDPLPDYYNNMPSSIGDSLTRAYAQQQWRQNVNVRQLNWDNFYTVNHNSYDNIANVNGVAGNNKYVNDSKYIVANTVQNQQHFNFNTIYNNLLSENINITAGLTYQYELSENYKEVADLLGGKYWLNYNHYAQLDYPGNITAAQNNLNQPNELVGVGGKYGYDYKYVNHHGLVWIQPRFHFKRLDFFASAELSATSFWRNGLYRNGLFPDDSYGKSATETFINYAFKAGINYQLDKQNALYANGLYRTQAPHIGDAFQSAQDRNQLVDNLKSEQVYSVEGGYQFISPKVKARATFYFTQTNNHTHNISFYDDQLYTDVNYALTGINIRDIGGEGVVEANLYKGFGALAIANIGRHIYTSRPNATVTDNNNAQVLISNETIYEKGYSVGGSPQLALTFGLNYRSPQFWYVDLYFNYYDWSWVSPNPARLTADAVAGLTPNTPAWNDIVQQERLPSAFTMDLIAGYSWRMNNQFKKMKNHSYYMVFSLNVSNLTNNQHFIVNAYEQNSFNFSSNAITRYPTKYTYMYGTNYLFTVAFKMN